MSNKIVAQITVSAHRGDGFPIEGIGSKSWRDLHTHETGAILRHRAAHIGLDVVTMPDRVIGLWQGKLEPTWALTVIGTDDQVQRYAETLATLWHQDAVMVRFTGSDQPTDTVMRMFDVYGEHIADILAGLAESGYEGATYSPITGSLIAFDSARPAEWLRARAYHNVDTHVRFIERPAAQF